MAARIQGRPKFDADRVRYLHSQNLTTKELARRFDKHVHTIRAWLKSLGLKANIEK